MSKQVIAYRWTTQYAGKLFQLICNYSPLTRGEVLFAFTGFLTANCISLLPAGDKFMVVFSKLERDKVTVLLEKKHAAALSAMPSAPPGAMNWGGADLDQILAL